MRLTFVLLAILALLFPASLVTGTLPVSAFESLRAMFTESGTPIAVVMQQIRLPRALLAVVIGGSLGLAGAAMQGYLRNPLAEPGLIGVTGAAGFGAVLALQTGVAASFALALPLSALTAALIAVLLLLALAGPRGASLTLILAGIAISALATALTSLVLNLSPNPFAASEIVFWMLGSLSDRSLQHVWIALPFMLVGWILLGLTARGLDALALGEDAAASMGVNLPRLRLMLVVGTAACVGAGTAVAGAIGFVGLVVPHVLRPFVGGQPSRLLCASALGGAALVLAADIAVRVLMPDRDLKLGVLMALIGAPLFLHLIYKTRGEFR